MLFRQIWSEMALDRIAAALDAMSDAIGGAQPESSTPRAKRAEERWMGRDDAARRGWIAGQAVVLVATALAMLMMHRFAAWLAALLVLGQGVYFIWREWMAR